ncbi:MAG: CARDB domain-containing protein [Dehalococcoidia bacterium]
MTKTTTNPVPPAPAVAGGPVTYRISVANVSGPGSIATPANIPIVIRDTLPATATFNSIVSAGGFTCTPPPPGPGGVLTCSRATPLNPGDVAVLDFSVTTGNSPNPITNTVEVDPNNAIPETNEGNNTASVTTPVQLPNLTISKAINGGPGPVIVGAGTNVTYTLTVNNAIAGGPNVSGIVVTDQLPAGTALVSAAGTNGFSCTFASGTVTCTGGSIAAGASATITIIVTAPSTAGNFVNTAQVDPGNTIPETNDGDNTSNAVTGTVQNPNLAIAKTARPVGGNTGDPVQQGNDLDYTITVTNLPGSPNVTGVVVRDQLPAGTTFKQIISASDGFTCAHAAGVVTCSGGHIAGDLVIANQATIVIRVNVNQNAPGTITNFVEVDPNNTIAETNELDNSFSLDTPVIAPALDLAIGKVANVGTAAPNGAVTYTITVSNFGAVPANNVTVRDVLAAGTTFVSANGSNGFTCSFAAGMVTCSGGTVAAGGPGTATITINILAPTALGNFNNQAEVDPANNIPESNEGNNLSNIVGVNVVGADLAVIKSASPTRSPRVSLDYTIVVSNALGQANANNGACATRCRRV